MTFKVTSPSSFRKPRRYVNRVFIHCSASDADSSAFYGTALAETIDNWHVARGWAGIGYHYVIDKQGVLVTGRDIEHTPAAQANNNIGTVAICCHGLLKDAFTPVQLETLKNLCKQINEESQGSVTFHGHCEVSAKTCPVLDYKKLLQLDAYGRLGKI